MVWTSIALVPRVTPGERAETLVPSNGPSLLPSRFWSEGSAQLTSGAFADGLHACIGVPTEKRPSNPKSQVGFVGSRA